MQSNNSLATREIMLEMEGGIRVSLPRAIGNLSTFVLKEQGDWFEYEIRFLRRYLRPGMNVIDIGANYGLYSLTMARAVSNKGHVWAFEPASKTISYLKRSIALNHLKNITLIEQGLSDRKGEAKFFLSGNAELNTLNPKESSGPSEIIKLTTLDHCKIDFDWPQIDFIKLDAEGEEGKILAAGGRLLKEMSPLIMFELKHAKKINLPLINKFLEFGYRTYRLLPGPEILIPFAHHEKFDPYQLNLFCCKPDRAEALVSQGVLVEKFNSTAIAIAGRARDYISGLPYAAGIEDNDAFGDIENAEPQERMLDYYLASLDESLAASQRVACLGTAYQISTELTQRGILTIEQSATHARIACDFGERNRGVQLLLSAIRNNKGVSNLRLKQPFLPAVARYDRIKPGEWLNRWLVSSVLEKWVIEHAYSSYFTAKKALPALQRLSTLGFMDKAIKRRYDLVSKLKLNS